MTETLLGSSLFLLALSACGAQTSDPGAPGDDDPMGVDAAAGDLDVSIVDSTILDERGDVVALSGGEPVHDHAGPAIVLGASGCPAVFKYGYLMDPQRPAFGRETVPNPITWRFAAAGVKVAQADYRVRNAATTLLDWTPASADAAGGFPIELFRSGPHGVVELGAVADQYFIDFRVRDDQAREATVTGCWEHHPLAPPVSVGALAKSAAPDALAQFSFAADSFVSHFLANTAGVKVFEARVVHATAEPVTIELAMPVPTATFTKSVAIDLIALPTTANVPCGITCAPNSPLCAPEPADDPRCGTTTPSEPADPVIIGSLLDGTWAVHVIDARTQQQASECTVSGLTVRCALAPRQPAAAPKELVVQLLAANHPELFPASGEIGEFTFLNLTYTGISVDDTPKKFRCDSLVLSAANADGERFRTCTKFTTFHRLEALDQLRIAFDGPELAVKTAIPQAGGLPGTDLAAPATIPSGVVTGTAFVWDTGNDDLPGSQH